MKRNNPKNWEPDLFHLIKSCQKMREADNWNGVSLKEEYEDFLEYMEELKSSGQIEQLKKAEAFLEEHYKPLLGLAPTVK